MPVSVSEGVTTGAMSGTWKLATTGAGEVVRGGGRSGSRASTRVVRRMSDEGVDTEQRGGERIWGACIPLRGTPDALMCTPFVSGRVGCTPLARRVTPVDV